MMHVGVDLGGTNLRAAAFDEGGSQLATVRSPLATREPRAVLEAIVSAVEEISRSAGGGPESVGALCVALAGQIHQATGVVLVGPNLGWRDVPFGKMLKEAFSFPTRLENDLSAAAWGESLSGAGLGSEHLLLVFVGTGVGAAFIDSGRLIHGAEGLAGEIGHTKVVPEGEPCGCGERGCLEAYTGGLRMSLRARRMWEERGVESVNGVPLEKATMKTVHQAFQQDDPVARLVLEEAGEHLGLAVANLVTMLNPSRLVLGGGVLLKVPYLTQRVRDSVAQLTSIPARRSLIVELARLGDDAGLIGAAHLARALP